MSRAQTGPLAAYNSLTDKHLTGYFNNTRVRRHLQRVGLVTRNGRIVSEKEYRLNVARQDHQKYVRDSLAQAVYNKVLTMEGERTRRPDDDVPPRLSPRPPAVARNCHRSLSGPNMGEPGPLTSTTSPRPSTAPGEMERPMTLVPLAVSGGPSGAVTGSHPSPAGRPREQRGVDPRGHPLQRPEAGRTLADDGFAPRTIAVPPPRHQQLCDPRPPLRCGPGTGGASPGAAGSGPPPPPKPPTLSPRRAQ
ncbi:glutamate-rich protein 3-like [Rhinoraja longicauda]